MRRRWLALLPLSMSACLSAARPPDAVPRFDPIAFFSGETEGEGRLKVIASSTRAVRVRGTGVVEDDGTLRLVQRVDDGQKPETQREWLIGPNGNGRYAGTLSDARGSVTGLMVGGRLHLQFRGAHGVRIDQWLAMKPDGSSATNVLTARKFGIVMARLNETIRKIS